MFQKLAGLFSNSKKNTGIKTVKNDAGSVTVSINEYALINANKHKFNSCVVIDFITTGTDAKSDDILEIGAVRMVNFEVVDTFRTYVHTNKEISNQLTSITGITNLSIAKAPRQKEALKALVKFIGKDLLIAYDAPFIINFLLVGCYKYRIELEASGYMCGLELAKTQLLNLENYSLETLTKHYNIECELHNALDKCSAIAKIVSCVAKELNIK